MTKFNLEFSEKKIHELAAQYDVTYDEPMRKMQSVIRERGWVTLPDLKRIRKWLKLRFWANTQKTAVPQQVVGVTAFALATCDEHEKWQALVNLKGVGTRAASALLHWFSQGNYPIVSEPSLWSCGVDIGEMPDGDVAFWIAYTKFCREKAERNGVSMRVLDRALSQHHYNVKAK